MYQGMLLIRAICNMFERMPECLVSLVVSSFLQRPLCLEILVLDR